ncbi:ABC transporter permease [Desulfocicer niacini]
MANYALRRLGTALIVLSGVMVLTFFLMHLTGGDPAVIIALDRYGAQLISPESVRALALEHGLDQPLYKQFMDWAFLLMTGDLGVSLRTGVPVAREIATRLPASLGLASASVAICALIGIPLGIRSALCPDGYLDRATRILASIKVSVPGFYMAMLLIYLFSIRLRWLPSFGTGSPAHWVLPVAVHVLGQLGLTLRVVRSAMLEVLNTEYIRYARLRGLSSFRVLYVHGLRNAAIPVFTYLSLQFLMVMEGSVIVESIFAWPGVGKLFQEAVFGRDFTMVQALVLFFGITIVLVNTAMDFAYLIFNRKIPLPGEKI